MQVLGDATAWLTVLLSVVLSLLPAFILKIYNDVYNPRLHVIAAELQRKHYAELRPNREYWCACLCCGKGAFANVPVDGDEVAGIDLTVGGEAGGDVELTNEAKQYENPMKKAEYTASDNKLKAFKNLRQRLA